MSSLMACIAGMALDAVFGDPVWLYHPVRMETGFRYWKSGCADFAKMRKGKRESQGGFCGLVWLWYPLEFRGDFCILPERSVSGFDLHWKPSGVISFLPESA